MMRILYDSKDDAYKKPFGALSEGERCQITIRIPVSCLAVAVRLVIDRDGMGEYASFVMNEGEHKEDYVFFSCEFSLPKSGLYFYYFRIETVREAFSLYKQDYNSTNMEAGELWQLTCAPADYRVYDEYAGMVMYQIFPDRFYEKTQAVTGQKPAPAYLHPSKSEIPDYLPDDNGEMGNCDFYGGNLAGITEKLDYLQELGVRILYLNPIFKAASNHRYDTVDYMKIDELLGTEEDFQTLCDMAHQRDIRIILDGVFAHTGRDSIYFQDALSNPDSPCRCWYEFEEYPTQYVCWWGIRTLPSIRKKETSFWRYVIDAPDSVISHWLMAGADGFRLDVADELSDEFIKRLRYRMKQLKPDSLLIGEVWEDASNKISYGKRRRYFTDGELDSVMNYPFRQAILSFVKGEDAGEQFRETVMTISENYPRQALVALMNMLSTHDTPRILSMLGEQWPITRDARAGYRMNETMRNMALVRVRCAMFLQFVLPGMPCIYYGDEIGMEGFEDPFCRGYFEWDDVEGNPLLEFVKRLCHMRNGCVVLQRGDIHVDVLGDGCVSVIRRWNGQECRATVNIGKSMRLCKKGKILLAEGCQSEGEYITVERFGFLCDLA